MMSYRFEDMQIEGELPIESLVAFRRHSRLRVFYYFGTECISCGVVGTKLLFLRNKSTDEVHRDIYTDRNRLMTIDHILPRAKGGSNRLSNLQPMCYSCNQLKSDQLLSPKELQVLIQVQNQTLPEWKQRLLKYA